MYQLWLPTQTLVPQPTCTPLYGTTHVSFEGTTATTRLMHLISHTIYSTKFKPLLTRTSSQGNSKSLPQGSKQHAHTLNPQQLGLGFLITTFCYQNQIGLVGLAIQQVHALIRQSQLAVYKYYRYCYESAFIEKKTTTYFHNQNPYLCTF